MAVGNAALEGRDVSAFWPNLPLLQYYKQLEFVIALGDERYGQAAPDPIAWFAGLKRTGCLGLRLHNAPMHQDQAAGLQSERMLVGLVGGGPRWLIEAVYPTNSQIWEGFDRLGDRHDPHQKIWLGAYVMLGETEPQRDADDDVAGAAEEVRAALVDIEGLARDIPGAPFAGEFAGARAALDGAAPTYPSFDFVQLTNLDPPAVQLLAAAAQGWVFGAMGSWNDIGVEETLSARYAATSEALFVALQRAVIAVANSSLRC